MGPIHSVSVAGNLSQTSPGQSAQETNRLQQAAQEMEGVFLGMLMKAMRSTVGSGGLFKEGMDTQTYRDMFDQELSRTLARAGGIGLAQMVLRDQLLRQSGKAEGNGGVNASSQVAGSIVPSTNAMEVDGANAPGKKTP